jgi:transcription initiation factor IIE alpha subunit
VAELHHATSTADNAFTSSSLWWDAPRILVVAEDAERAKQLLLELEAQELRKAQEAETRPPIEAVCEECGNRSSFPGSQRGSAQECPKCGEYLDVGDEELPVEHEKEADST